MADFASWQHSALAKLAADQQAEIVRLNNEHVATLAQPRLFEDAKPAAAVQEDWAE